MKSILSFLLGCACCLSLAFFYNNNSQIQEDCLTLFKKYIEGEFDNFQQCWQENTKTDNHRVAIEHKHNHFHTIIRSISTPNAYTINHSEGSDTAKILGQRIVVLSKGTAQNEVIMTVFDKKDLTKPLETVKWQLNKDVFTGQEENRANVWQLKKEGLWVLNDKTFKNASGEPYRMLKCRFFKGWIQLPMDNVKKDSVYHFGNLRIHDQGGNVQLKLPDGTPVNYSVELTQLIFGKNLPIFKLAVYEIPAKELDYNSHSIAYTWTNPEAMRLGINLRKLLSGWTLDDPNMWNSDSKK